LARLIFILMLIVALPAYANDKIKIGGTGSGLELVRQLGNLYAKQHQNLDILVVPSLGSTGGIKALQAGALDLAISARPVKPEEKEVKSIHLCRTPVAFAVHPASTVSAIHTNDLVQLYGNASQIWPDGGRVRVLLRPDAEIDTILLRSISPAVDQSVSQAKARPGMLMAVTDQDNLKLLQTTPGAFGMTTLAMATAEQAKVRLVSFNGTKPTLQTLIQGHYPLVRDYYLVTRPPVRKPTQNIINFVRSAKAITLMKALNCAPMEQH
jgi:phosphate transport system substrate-binding protein